jgi:predicted DNA-binding transcriptional regulator AlpA
MKMQKLLKIKDVAEILGRSPVTVRVDVSRRPETLPPRIVMPGSNRVVWDAKDVADWLAKQKRSDEVAV